MNLIRTELKVQSFTPALQNFNSMLSDVSREKEFPDAAFIRDYEHLPERSPFDIDMIIPTSLWPEFKALVSDNAGKCGLMSTINQGPNFLHILVLDPNPTSIGRTWAYYEIRENLTLTNDLTVTGEMLKIDYVSGIPCPNPDWLLLLRFVQAIRKNRLELEEEELLKLLADNCSALSFTANLLNIPESQFLSYLKEGYGCNDVASALGITMQTKKRLLPHRTRTRVKRKFYREIFFLKNKSQLLYTIHGSDGVGKTTVCNLVEKVFSSYPLSFTTFHHIAGWKYLPAEEEQTAVPLKLKKPSIQPYKKSLWRCVLSSVYKRLPFRIRELWVRGIGHARYCKNLNQLIMNKHEDGTIVLIDRYLHDMWVKNKLMLGSGEYIDKFFGHLFRKPRLAIILVDKPESVHERKQELTVKQIALYQTYIKEVLVSTKVKNEVVAVENRSAEQVARAVIQILINNMGNQLISLVRTEAANKDIERNKK